MTNSGKLWGGQDCSSAHQRERGWPPYRGGLDSRRSPPLPAAPPLTPGRPWRGCGTTAEPAQSRPPARASRRLWLGSLVAHEQRRGPDRPQRHLQLRLPERQPLPATKFLTLLEECNPDASNIVAAHRSANHQHVRIVLAAGASRGLERGVIPAGLRRLIRPEGDDPAHRVVRRGDVVEIAPAVAVLLEQIVLCGHQASEMQTAKAGALRSRN